MKQYTATLRLIDTKLVGKKRLDIKDTVHAENSGEARQILESRHSDRTVLSITEVRQEAPAKGVGRVDRSGNLEQTSEVMGGSIVTYAKYAVVALAIYGAISLFDAPETSSPPQNPSVLVEQVASHGSQDLRNEQTSAESPKIYLGASREQPRPEQLSETTSDTTFEVNPEFPHLAFIVDRRESIVLQSGPGLTSKNVARLLSGSKVMAASSTGKWIRVQTPDGLIGYVRQKQLRFDQQRR